MRLASAALTATSAPLRRATRDAQEPQCAWPSLIGAVRQLWGYGVTAACALPNCETRVRLPVPPAHPHARTHARSCARAPARTRAPAHARVCSLATLLLKLHSSMEEHRSHEPGIPGQYRVELASLIGATASTAAYEASGRSRFDSSVRHAAETLAPAIPGLGTSYTE